MDTSLHNLEALFKQLGLSSRPEDIDNFIGSIAPPPAEISLEGAAFWSVEQAQLLTEAKH